jgi:predicted nucleic acid-binding protein
MRAVFADTFYFLGLLNRADESHGRCAAFARDYREVIITTSYVLVELADGLARPRYRVQAARFIQALQNHARVKIVPASDALLARGLEFYAARPDKEWTLTDCVSFVIMRERGVTDALTGDKHFEQAGFVALLK